jgi:hypothetical protein
VKYLDCVVENNRRGGVEFYSGEYAMENCIIRNNRGTGITVNKDARAFLTNCTIDNQKNHGVYFGGGGLTMKHCTIYNSGEALTSYLPRAPEAFEVTNCAFINNRKNLNWAKADGVVIANARLQGNRYTPAGFRIFGKDYGAHQWADYQQATGLDGDSLMQKYEGTLPPHRTNLTIGDQDIGADMK